MARHDYEGFGEWQSSGRDIDDDDRFGSRRDRFGRQGSTMRGRDRFEQRDEQTTFPGYGRGLDERGEFGRGEMGYGSSGSEHRYGGDRNYGMGSQSRMGSGSSTRSFGQRDRDYGWNERSMGYGGGMGGRYMESDDQSDRTYGTRIGQGMSQGHGQNYGQNYGQGYGRMIGQQHYGQGSYGSESGYGAGSYGGVGGEQQWGYGYGYGDENRDEGALSNIGHRIGSFVKGVFQGGNKRPFRGPKGYTRSDERIREDVCDALANLGEVDPSEVEVSVAQGEVTLTGTVPHRHWKHQMEDAAESIPGVKDVTNNIRVKAREEAEDMTRTQQDKSLTDVFSSSSNQRRNGNRLSHS